MKETDSRVAGTAAVIETCRREMARRIVGQSALVDGILMGMIAGGHVLLEGVPGLAKTLAVKTLAEIADLSFKRVQFTSDLLPADLIGTLVYEQAKAAFSVRKGPIFANLILADEINRAPAKVQSALLEAMAEGQVTIGDTTYRLPSPFLVLATQNPIEQEGTYPLPEAELDRFLLKLMVPYPSLDEEAEIVRASRDGYETRDPDRLAPASPAITARDIETLREAARAVRVDDSIVRYLVAIVAATRPLAPSRRDRRTRDDYLKYISFGASPRASIALHQCSRINALFAGRDYVIPEDVKAVAPAALRHRLVLSYEAGADGLSADDLVSDILGIVPVP